MFFSHHSAVVAVSVTVFLAGLPGALWAVSLDQALAQSLGHDPEFLAAQKAAIASQERVKQARARLGPLVSAELETRTADVEIVNNGTKTELDQRNYTVSLRQPLLNFGLSRSLSQAEQRAQASDAGLQQARQDATLRLVAAYFDILIAQDSLATVQAEKAAIAEQLQLAKRSFEVGTSTITDQQEAQARFDLTSAREIAAQNQLDIARQALTLLTRQPTPETLKGIRTDYAIPSPEPRDIQAWVEAARKQNPSVMRSRLLSEAALTEISRRRAAHLPSVNLVASHARNWETTTPTDQTRRDLVGVVVSVPLLGGPIYAEVREATALAEEESHRADSALLSAEQAARSAYLSVLSGLAQIKALEAAEKSSQLALASNKLGYEVGVRINIDVLNAQQQLFAAQRDLSKARYDTLLASLRLKSATGQLTDADVIAIAKLLN